MVKNNTENAFYDVEALLKDTDKYVAVYIEGEKVAIDYEMAPIIDYFNSHGVKTLACCQGVDITHLHQNHGMMSYILFSQPLEATPLLYQFYQANQDLMEIEYVGEMYFLAAKPSLISSDKEQYLWAQAEINHQFKAQLNQFVFDDILSSYGHQNNDKLSFYKKNKM